MITGSLKSKLSLTLCKLELTLAGADETVRRLRSHGVYTVYL